MTPEQIYNTKYNVDESQPIFYHGTSRENAESIRKNGFYKQHDVNMTSDYSEAEEYTHYYEDGPTEILKVRLKKGAKSKGDQKEETDDFDGLDIDSLDFLTYDADDVVLDYSETIKNKFITENLRKFIRKTILESLDTNLNDNFRKWFAGSKVTDKSGNPLICHHGTSEKFSRFSIKKSTMGIIWFTSNKASIESGEVGAQGKGHIMDLYVCIKKPASWDEYDKCGLQELEDMGYDGAILPNGDGTITGFVFEPEQLKSVINKGEWNSVNKNIFKETKI